ncbi:hypothetical protein Rsub_12149 [Raphidocelis subcapitata]|uniref:Protein kinase domain-containing protein n=1 Tax=Raphidocelis subcapitata TaxID=307507 RepID=A0A2V0PI47_9CHLO|nr:hypothetical protein Rsub_12149 [Raphidocelis subcapitata]|eukprot:GBF99481.1 hypothetical protein Rsub_12149 [Raphidocelis subcapitata]
MPSAVDAPTALDSLLAALCIVKPVIPTDWDPLEQRGTTGHAVYSGGRENRAVYEATAPDGRRVVAKSFLLTALAVDDFLCEQAENEIFYQQLFKHAAIVPLLAAFTTPSHLHLVFEYAGYSLDLLFGGLEALDCPLHEVEAALQAVLRQVGPALVMLHRAGYIHSDIKPENLVLRFEKNGDITARLIDMASCVYSDGPRLREWTPAYVAPEYAAAYIKELERTRGDTAAAHASAGATLSASYDARSLAVALAELALMVPLFEGRSASEGRSPPSGTRSASAGRPPSAGRPAAAAAAKTEPPRRARRDGGARPAARPPPHEVLARAREADPLLVHALVVEGDPNEWRRCSRWGTLSQELRDVIEAMGHADPGQRATVAQALAMPFATADKGEGPWRYVPPYLRPKADAMRLAAQVFAATARGEGRAAAAAARAAARAERAAARQRERAARASAEATQGTARPSGDGAACLVEISGPPHPKGVLARCQRACGERWSGLVLSLQPRAQRAAAAAAALAGKAGGGGPGGAWCGARLAAEVACCSLEPSFLVRAAADGGAAAAPIGAAAWHDMGAGSPQHTASAAALLAEPPAGAPAARITRVSGATPSYHSTSSGGGGDSGDGGEGGGSAKRHSGSSGGEVGIEVEAAARPGGKRRRSTVERLRAAARRAAKLWSGAAAKAAAAAAGLRWRRRRMSSACAGGAIGGVDGGAPAA